MKGEIWLLDLYIDDDNRYPGTSVSVLLCKTKHAIYINRVSEFHACERARGYGNSIEREMYERLQLFGLELMKDIFFAETETHSKIKETSRRSTPQEP